jgi:hypothetical protein
LEPVHRRFDEKIDPIDYPAPFEKSGQKRNGDQNLQCPHIPIPTPANARGKAFLEKVPIHSHPVFIFLFTLFSDENSTPPKTGPGAPEWVNRCAALGDVLKLRKYIQVAFDFLAERLARRAVLRVAWGVLILIKASLRMPQNGMIM